MDRWIVIRELPVERNDDVAEYIKAIMSDLRESLARVPGVLEVNGAGYSVNTVCIRCGSRVHRFVFEVVSGSFYGIDEALDALRPSGFESYKINDVTRTLRTLVPHEGRTEPL